MPSFEQSALDKETLPGQDGKNVKPPYHEPEVSDEEKIALAVLEGHDADIPSNEGYIAHEKSLHHKASSGSSKTETAVENVEVQVDIEKGLEPETKEIDDPNIVWWDGPDDRENPMNWGDWLKRSNIFIISAICFVTPLASSMFAPGVPQLMEEFNSTSVELASFVVSVYILGFAVGPLFLAPASEVYGRLPVYHICNVLFLVFTIACALATNLNMLIGFRFMAGIWGSCPLTNGGGTIADIVSQENRGKAMSFFVMGPIIGPIVGPICGGYLTQAKGWRWIFWVLSMLSGVFLVGSILLMRETYAVVILKRKTLRLQKETGNMDLRSKLDAGLSAKDYFKRSIIRPAKMLIMSPVVLSTSLYVGVIYGYLYLLFTTFTVVFEETYNFSPGSVGLTYLGLGVGSLAGLFFFAWISDRTVKARTAAADRAAQAEGREPEGMKPEYRLPPMIPCAVLIPAGFFIYGWTAQYHVHWIVPILSTGLIGVGNISTFMSIQTYLVDAYTVFAASALAANAVVRSVLGAVLPLAGQQMYDTLGLGWGNSLLAFIAIGLLPVPWALFKWGEVLRKKFNIDSL
ncbi:bicyclomycin resistance protein [Xylogone sp. PMI_703]|nr:bicyclomycin resistance protein [Xylogone sp. PMI_703]